MNIAPITNYNNNSSKYSFKGSDFYSPIKKLPKMICASCGKPTLYIDNYVKVLSNICKPLSKNLENGVFDLKFQKSLPLIYAKLLEFANLYPKKNIDEILESEKGAYTELKRTVVETLEDKTIKNNTPERFALDRRINGLFFDTIEIARSQMKMASTTMKHLLKLKDYLEGFNDVKKEAFTQLEIYARKYPRKTLSEIVQIPEIASFHRMKNILQQTEAREKTNYHFENIQKLVEKKNPNAVEYFENLKTKVLDMYETEPDEKARKYISKSMYHKALKEYNCEGIEDAVLKELNQIPTTYITKDTFFAVAANKKFTDAQIVDAFFKDILTSEDHALAISGGGRDYAGNKLVMHTVCNLLRGSKPYAVYLKYHPEMAVHTSEQIDLVSKNLLAEKLPDNLRTYPYRIAETLRLTSEDKLELDVNNYCKKIIAQSKKRVDKNNKAIKEAKTKQEIRELRQANNIEIKFQEKIQKYLEREKRREL